MKKLIYKDNPAKITFRKEVETVWNKCNILITVFNEGQDFETISTQKEFESLIQNPVSYFDDILIQNCEIKSKVGRMPEPSMLANLFGINRDGYLEAIGWETVEDSKCKGCTTTQVQLIHQKEIITAEKFSYYAAYLLFENRFFKFNEPAIEEKLKEFDIYAESPDQLRLLEHYETLCKVLNNAIEVHKVGTIKIQELARMFGLQILDNKLVYDYIELAQQIKYIKS
jgi:hypothetical protein